MLKRLKCLAIEMGCQILIIIVIVIAVNSRFLLSDIKKTVEVGVRVLGCKDIL